MVTAYIIATVAVGAIGYFGVTPAISEVARRPDLTRIGDVSFRDFAPLIPTVIAIMMIDFFDTLGTGLAVGSQGGLQDNPKRPFSWYRFLLADSLGAFFGGSFRSSSNTTYIESAAGVADGARTGLASVVTGLLFLLAVFLSPLAGLLSERNTAPALIIVGFFMMGSVGLIPFSDERVDAMTTTLPAFVTMITIPLTFDIGRGIGYGFLVYVFLKAVTGKWREVHPLLLVVGALFLAVFIWGAIDPQKVPI